MGKGPGLRGGKRPLSLLCTFMEALETKVVQRIKTILAPEMTGSQYAYQSKRSTELLLADLDSHIRGKTRKGEMRYKVGLHIEGAFDNADLELLIEALRKYKIPEIIYRFARKLADGPILPAETDGSDGAVFQPTLLSKPRCAAGGVLSPLLWLVLLNHMPRSVRSILAQREPSMEAEGEVLLQVFADDISAAVSAEDEQEVVKKAYLLVDVFTRLLKELGLVLRTEKRKNFWLKLREELLGLFKRNKDISKWFKNKEKLRETALKQQNIEVERAPQEPQVQLPYKTNESFRLLGLQLDHNWSFKTHLQEIQKKLRVRSAVLRQVGGTSWGLGTEY